MRHKLKTTIRYSGVDVLFDDREVPAGEKFADADLMGMPLRVVISDKSLLSGGVEIKERGSEKSEIVSIDAFLHSYTTVCV